MGEMGSQVGPCCIILDLTRTDETAYLTLLLEQGDTRQALVNAQHFTTSMRDIYLSARFLLHNNINFISISVKMNKANSIDKKLLFC